MLSCYDTLPVISIRCSKPAARAAPAADQWSAALHSTTATITQQLSQCCWRIARMVQWHSCFSTTLWGRSHKMPPGKSSAQSRQVRKEYMTFSFVETWVTTSFTNNATMILLMLSLPRYGLLVVKFPLCLHLLLSVLKLFPLLPPYSSPRAASSNFSCCWHNAT